MICNCHKRQPAGISSHTERQQTPTPSRSNDQIEDISSPLIRYEERYGLVKIKVTELEAEHQFCWWLCLLLPNEKYIVGVGSTSGRISQSQCWIPGLVTGLSLSFCLRLPHSSFHWIISDGVVDGIGRNGNVLTLPTPILSSQEIIKVLVELLTPLTTPIFDFH